LEEDLKEIAEKLGIKEEEIKGKSVEEVKRDC